MAFDKAQRVAQSSVPCVAPDRYTIASIFRSLGQTGDPWASIDDNPLDATRLWIDLALPDLMI